MSDPLKTLDLNDNNSDIPSNPNTINKHNNGISELLKTPDLNDNNSDVLSNPNILSDNNNVKPNLLTMPDLNDNNPDVLSNPNILSKNNNVEPNPLIMPDLNDYSDSLINDSNIISELLKIPDLNDNNYSGSLELSYNNYKNIIIRYNVPECDYGELLGLTNECLKIQINSNDKHSNYFFNNPFWFIRAFEEAIYPLKFPGLIACPLLDEMEYLLQGPYPSIFSSEKHFKDCAHIKVSFLNNTSSHESATKSDKNPWIKYIKQIANDQNFKFHYLESDVSKIDKNPWIKYIKQILNDQNLKFHCLESDLNFYCSKSFYISLLLTARQKIVKNLPFQSSNILEKCFLNQKILKNTNYRYSLNSFSLSFFNYSRLNSRDCLTVWMMIYPDPVCLEKLLFTRNIDLSILAKRACFQKEYDLLDLIVKRASPIKKQISKNKVSTLRFLFFKKQPLKPKKSSKYVFSILENIESDASLFTVPINFDLDVKFIKHSNLKYSTLFEFKGRVFELMKPKDIFLCLAKNLFFEQVLGSIAVYLKYQNLPFPDERVSENTKKQSDFSIFMSLKELKLLSSK